MQEGLKIVLCLKELFKTPKKDNWKLRFIDKYKTVLRKFIPFYSVEEKITLETHGIKVNSKLISRS